MKKRPFLQGCLLFAFFILIAIAAGWWFLRRPVQTTQASISPVLVFILSPSSGDEMAAGDFVPLTVQVDALDTIASVELFVDGQSLGKAADPTNAGWTWQAWPLGIHSFYAQATDAKGQVGYSQVVLVNVLAGDGAMDVFADEGQTLEQIGAGFGVPPDQMAGANPKIDPSLPLPGGNPVKVPIGNGQGSGQGQNPGGGKVNPIPNSILWSFKPSQTVDKSYCYVSGGNGVWEKMPKDPWEFFEGVDNLYTQLTKAAQQVVIQAQCWGWVGGVLKYLGQGQTKFDTNQPPGEIQIIGGDFILTGVPNFPIKEDKFLGGSSIPPPFALREPSSVNDCAAHGDPMVVPLLCNGVMSAKVKEHVVLVWEWSPKVCWPGLCNWNNEIAGYGVYEIDPFTNAKKFLANIKPPLQKVAFIPLPWGAKCYGVEAYVDMPGAQVSEMTTYCPGDQPKSQKITLTPTEWVTTGGQWIQDGDCDTYGGADYYLSANQQQGFGNQAGQVLAGSYLVDDDEEDCYREGDYSAAVKFDLQLKLPPSAVIQKAELVFSKAFMNYGATALAAPSPSSCVKNVGKAKQDWSGLIGSVHFSNKNVLSGPSYFAPLASISPYMALNADVTPAVMDWLKKPANNHGLILTPAAAPHPLDDGSGFCISGLGNFQLNVYYFAPP